MKKKEICSICGKSKCGHTKSLLEKYGFELYPKIKKVLDKITNKSLVGTLVIVDENNKKEYVVIDQAGDEVRILQFFEFADGTEKQLAIWTKHWKKSS